MLSFCIAPYRVEKSEASCRTSSGQVAENMRVCRRPGTLFRIVRIWGSKPMLNIRSASSRTT